mmetsp:Transcript_6471/g.21639  ORF Transcript_6471/g.21639 Transcript_6471/m.21639 type:complete len:209 (-) Transcript_6471:67-693(-)
MPRRRGPLLVHDAARGAALLLPRARPRVERARLGRVGRGVAPTWPLARLLLAGHAHQVLEPRSAGRAQNCPPGRGGGDGGWRAVRGRRARARRRRRRQGGRQGLCRRQGLRRRQRRRLRRPRRRGGGGGCGSWRGGGGGGGSVAWPPPRRACPPRHHQRAPPLPARLDLELRARVRKERGGVRRAGGGGGGVEGVVEERLDAGVQLRW